MIIQAAEKRRLPRFHITPCQFHDGRFDKNFSVQDISLGGLALRLFEREDLPAFAVGTEHQGVVKVEGQKIECRFQVRYLRGTLVGGEWLKPSKELLAHLEQISHPESLGAHLKKYDLSEMPGTTWYHNAVGVDLLIYASSEPGSVASSSLNERIHRWTLYIHHSFIQWESETGIRTGRAVAEDEEGYAHGIVRLETRLIEYDEHTDRTLLESALKLVQAAPLEDADIKKWIEAQLSALAT